MKGRVISVALLYGLINNNTKTSVSHETAEWFKIKYDKDNSSEEKPLP